MHVAHAGRDGTMLGRGKVAVPSGDLFGRTLGLSLQRHAVLPGLVSSLAVSPCLGHDAPVRVDVDSDEALVALDVTPLRVSVDEASLRLLPLAEAPVLALLVDLAGVVAVEHGVKHDLGIVAVGVALGAEVLGIRDDSGVLSHQGAVWGLFRAGPAHGKPLLGGEVLR